MTAPKRTRRPRSQCDAVAREAARQLTDGKASDINEARQRAAEALDLSEGRVRRASAKRIRQHAQAMDMQSMGEEAYRRQIRRWLELAEDLMSTIEAALPDSETRLVGRAAEGHFDGDPELRFRVLTEIEIGEMARLLAEYGYDVPDAIFPTMEASGGGKNVGGRLSQMQWRDEGGVRITLTRCPHRAQFENRLNLATGELVARLTHSELLTMLQTR